jgi:hypothetical protein
MTRWTRRRVLTVGLGSAAALAAGGVSGLELISRGLLPGKLVLDTLDGACSVPGCHTGAFFAAQQPPSLAFLARHLAS